MSAGLAISAGLQIFGALKGRSDQKKAANAQAAIDAENLANLKAENTETLSRAKSDVAALESTGKARGAASGFAAGSVKASYLERLSAVHKRDIDWLETAQASNVRIAGSEASQRARIAKSNLDSSFMAGLGGGFSTGFKAFGRFQDTGGWWS